MRSLQIAWRILPILVLLVVTPPAFAQVTCTVDAECDDLDACTGIETCVSGECQPGTPVVCTALDQCHVAGTCDPSTGLCDDPEATDGTACDDGDLCTTDDACQAGACTANPVVCTAADQCHVAGTCDPSTGLCSNPDATDGTACDDGALCTTGDACVAGTCAGAPVVCTALDQCHVAGTCDPGTGLCSNPDAIDGTACNDGALCTTGDVCVAGSCGGTPVVCTAADQCHVAGTCDPSTGVCSNPDAIDGTACNDGALCSTGDACVAGSCTGTPVVCTALDQCHVAGTCDPSSGVCSNPDATDGTTCDDGTLCTTTDTCQAGACAGTPVVCTASDQCHVVGTCDPSTGVCSNPNATDGTACNDGAPCTTGDTCQAGSCTGTGVVCTALDQCHIAGTCDPASGLCSNPTAGNGTACNDGDLCTTADACQSGICTGTAVVCTALDQCHAVGTCDPTTGVCSNPNVTDGTVCSDGLFCNVGETCTGGACGGGIARDCSSTSNQCNTGTCDEATDACVAQAANEGLPCNDTDACTATDVCTAGVCGGTGIVDCAGPRVVVANNGAATATVIRSTDFGIEGTPLTGTAPQGVAVSPDGATAYVTNNATDNVSVIDLATRTNVGTIAVDIDPVGIAASTDGQFVYVANNGADTISVISGNALLRTIQLDPTATLTPFGPSGVAVTPNGAFIYVTNTLHNSVSVIRTSDDFILAEIPVARRPQGIAITPNGAYAYVACGLDNLVAVIRVADNSIVTTVPVGSAPFGVAVSWDGTAAWVTNSGSNTVSRIRTFDNRVSSTIPVAGSPTGVGVRASGNRAYVALTSTNRVIEIDTLHNTVGRSLFVGAAPVGVAVTGTTILQLSVTAAPTTVTPGSPVTFTINYGNSGSKTSQTVMLSASLPASATFTSATGGGVVNGSNVEWAIPTLAAGATGQVAFTVTVNNPLAPGTQITTNAVIIDAQGVTAQATASATVNSMPMYSLGKVADTDPVAAGGTLTYTITYANNAGANADGAGVSIAETYDPNFTFQSSVPATITGTNNQWAIGSLPIGGSGTIRVIGTVKSPLSDGTLLQNTATLRDAFDNQTTASITTGVVSSPLLAIALADDHDPVAAGSEVTYTINYTNTGNANATGVVVTATYDPNTIFVRSTPAPDASTTNRWTIGNLSTGTSGVIAVTVRLAGVLPNGTILTTQAAVTATGGATANAAENTTVSSAPALSVNLTDNPDPVGTGETLSYTITYGNSGTDVATGATITTSFDAGVTFLTAVPPPTTGTNQWALGDLAVGASGTIVVSVQVDAALGSILNSQVTIADTGGSSASALANTTVQITPILSVTSTDGVDPVSAGGLLTYTIRYGNTGNTAATNSLLAAVYDANVSFVSSTPSPDVGTTDQWSLGSINVGATGQVAVTVRANTPLTNGTVLGMQALLTADGGLSTNASQSTTVQSAPALALSKLDAADPVPPAGTIVYTLSYANTGNENTSNVVITEAYDPLVTFVSAVPAPDVGTTNRWTLPTLAAGDTGTIQITMAAPAAPNGTSVTNTATIQDSGGHSATATEQTTISSPLFSFDVADNNDPVTAGQAVQLTVSYGNISGTTQTGVVLQAVYANSFVVSETLPPPDGGSETTWTLGSLAPGQTGTLIVRGFFGASNSLPQTTFQLSSSSGTAYAAESTTLQGQAGATVRKLRLQHGTRTDAWALKSRLVPSTTAVLGGTPFVLEILGPGNVEHTNRIDGISLTEFRKGLFKYSGDVSGVGKVKIYLTARRSNVWSLIIRGTGPGSLPAYPTELRFFVVTRVGNTAWLSETRELRQGHRTVRKYP